MSDKQREVVDDQIVAAAIYDAYPVYNPGDITTWSAEQLDELAEFLIANDPDATVTDIPPAGFDAPHGINSDEEMLFTADRPAPDNDDGPHTRDDGVTVF